MSPPSFKMSYSVKSLAILGILTFENFFTSPSFLKLFHWIQDDGMTGNYIFSFNTLRYHCAVFCHLQYLMRKQLFNEYLCFPHLKGTFSLAAFTICSFSLAFNNFLKKCFGMFVYIAWLLLIILCIYVSLFFKIWEFGAIFKHKKNIFFLPKFSHLLQLQL